MSTMLKHTTKILEIQAIWHRIYLISKNSSTWRKSSGILNKDVSVNEEAYRLKKKDAKKLASL